MRTPLPILVHILISACFLGGGLYAQSTLSPEQSTTNDHFGHALATDLHWLVVGDPQDSSEGPLRGSVYIYKNDGVDWNFYQRLSPEVIPGNGLNVFFGTSLGIDGEWLFVGSPGDDEAGLNAGATHVYKYDEFTGNWEVFDKLFSTHPVPNTYFGNTVAVDSSANLAVIGQLDVTETGELHPWKLNIDDPQWISLPPFSNPSRATSSRFGDALQIEGNTILVGAPEEDSGRGRAWVMTFDNDQSVFVVDAELQPDSAVLAPLFGSSVSLSENGIVIGSPHDGDGESNGGSAYLFRNETGTWLYQDKFQGSSTQAGDGFGSSVSIKKQAVVVGGPIHNGESGDAYTFDVNGSSAVELLRLVPTDGIDQGYFGYSCLLAGETIAVGALAHANSDFRSGKVYIYPAVVMFGDFDYDSDLDIQDLLLLISAWGPCGETCAPDFDNNGQVDVIDLLAFIAHW